MRMMVGKGFEDGNMAEAAAGAGASQPGANSVPT